MTVPVLPAFRVYFRRGDGSEGTRVYQALEVRGQPVEDLLVETDVETGAELVPYRLLVREGGETFPVTAFELLSSASA